ncbi:MAG TPA: tRNA (guanosine(37)-N1)-methyltransferase TrmD [Pirellulaceae bacterium]|nr:tRNA (guanosine(37)-N1)-methyltransferase TrmD [Pirellulaceae bacterium]HMO94039.1 tRNA (guanosine(37)-N1)-methyltransferase TrmD [Pirellulaceae bacterium]HMP70909.1 tRNA (guanosine(37)-N1)-methyltransferase TrmD [Pirellulaceae bacterium]
MRFDVLTLFPEIFSGYLSQSILNKAIENRLIEVQLHNFRDWTDDPHRKVDDRPYGGGPGMVLMVEPVVKAVEEIWNRISSQISLTCDAVTGQPASDGRQLVLLSPVGRPLVQPIVEELATKQQILLMCGRYEGFDQRIIDILQPLELSIGDYIVNGGEVAAMVVIDAVSRLVPGVLGDESSGVHDSFSSGNRLLEYPQYTRPVEFRGHRVPDVLLSGNHENIRVWREQQSRSLTEKRRKDLFGK